MIRFISVLAVPGAKPSVSREIRSENSVSSDESKMILRLDSSSLSESEEGKNETSTASELGRGQVKVRIKRKRSRNHASGNGKTGGGKVRYLCTNEGCERSYTNKKAFDKHIHYECGKEPRFVCGYCGLKSPRAAHTRIHIVRKHKGCILNVLDTRNGNRIYRPTTGIYRPTTAITHSCMDKNLCVEFKMTRL
ncbi:hypothetical protein QAD02_022664 [Eretmocerus hayati]|uniref:Uncharacterized protein n=1 Tax=Eretmocerus hayati TaxID=131215 RepID=A0ACC2PTY0_9HYME|nr:hypothetical protein QAD02_022664 [Eretmocerus hayati]